MIKIFISQPMNGKGDEEILKERKQIIADAAVALQADRLEVIDSILDLAEGAKPLQYLAKSLDLLAGADMAVFGKGWDAARGCKIEHEAAVAYGIKTMEL